MSCVVLFHGVRAVRFPHECSPCPPASACGRRTAREKGTFSYRIAEGSSSLRSGRVVKKARQVRALTHKHTGTTTDVGAFEINRTQEPMQMDVKLADGIGTLGQAQ
jgi:hypothetical protein